MQSNMFFNLDDVLYFSGKDKRLWEEEVFKFARVHQLRAVSPYLPRDNDHHLDPHIYEMVLYEYLKLDPVVSQSSCQIFNMLISLLVPTIWSDSNLWSYQEFSL